MSSDWNHGRLIGVKDNKYGNTLEKGVLKTLTGTLIETGHPIEIPTTFTS